MAGRIPKAFVDELLARVDIVALINDRVPLKRAGRNFVACCPFHDEKTPSFTVSPSKQFYHCFGCGVSGSAIGFLMAYDHLTFPEAIEALAAQYGLEVPREARAEGKAKQPLLEELYRLNREVAAFYTRQLRDPIGRPAVDYLRRRGVDGATARRYGLGYAPPAWETLSRHFDPNLLERAGLVVARPGGGVRDLFRRRVIFPIRNRRGQVVGFGGRAVDDQSPKYINSPETEIFNKSREVYGLYELLQADGRPPRILVVEGYLDAIALAQYGFPYAVAVLGTAITSDHAQLLFQYTEELVFCFDGDAAGRKAAWRALEAVLPQLQSGRKASFLWLPQGEDPDSLLRKEGAQGFVCRLQRAEPLSTYFFRALGEGLNLSQLEDRASLAKRARPLLSQLPRSEFRRLMQNRLAELVGNSVVEIRAEHNKSRQRESQVYFLRQPQVEERIVALLIHHPHAFAHLPPAFLEAARRGQYGELLAQLILAWEEAPDAASTQALCDEFRRSPYWPKLQELLAQKEFQLIEMPERELQDAVLALLKRSQKARLKALTCKADSGGLSEEERAELRELMTEIRSSVKDQV